MARVILETTQPHTPDTGILGKDWYGEYQLTLEVAGTTPVILQRRVAPDREWKNARFNSTDISLSAEGDTLDVKLARDFDYRCLTETAGAEVWIAKHNPHD